MEKRTYTYRLLIPLIAIYLTFMLGSIVLVHKLVVISSTITAAGVFLFPATFVLGDVIAEVYGYQVARQLLWSAIVCEFLFALFCYILIHLKSPPFWHYQQDFNYILGGLLRIYFSGLFAFLIASFINVILLSKWKIALKGRYFWLRSVISSCIGEAIYTVICVSLIYYATIPFNKFIQLMISVYVITMLYIAIFAIPAAPLARFLKKIEGVDPFDYGINFNPFNSEIRPPDSKTENI